MVAMLLPLISLELSILIGTLQPLGNQGLIRRVIPYNHELK